MQCLFAPEEKGGRSNVACCRGFFETCTKPLGRCIGDKICGYERAGNLPDFGPYGSREDLLCGLGRCARLVYGIGFTHEETVGKFDPPLNGEGWKVVKQVCETKSSAQSIQAACYLKVGVTHDKLHPERDTRITKEELDKMKAVPRVAIVAFRGTASMEGMRQDISVVAPGLKRRIRRAVREAALFYLACEEALPHHKIYVTGHSLGGYIAEAVASYTGADGASFNNPGPWSTTRCWNVTGDRCPEAFETHLLRSDRVAALFFPKPENSSHIGSPIWHEGKNHRCCRPYVVEVEKMFAVQPNDLPFDPETHVDQMEGLEDHYADALDEALVSSDDDDDE